MSKRVLGVTLAVAAAVMVVASLRVVGVARRTAERVATRTAEDASPVPGSVSTARPGEEREARLPAEPAPVASPPAVRPSRPVHPKAQAEANAPPAVATREEHKKDEALRVAGTLPAAMALGVEGGVVGGVPGGTLGGRVDDRAASRRYAAPVELPADLASAEHDTEAYDRIRDNPFLSATEEPLSTFSIDVDTASYANVRRFLFGGQLPPKDAVRVEELVNYFRYDYPEPRGAVPFSVTTEVAACPWRPEHRLLLVGLRGRAVEQDQLPPRRLTFLLDVSGSMDAPDKLPLLKEAMALLVEGLREQDKVAIVVYAGSSGLVLPPTSGEQKAEIRAALAALSAGGSTAGGAGIELAYKVAAEIYERGAINRVLLATDGDFNVGTTSVGALSRLIEEKRKSGVFLSVLGFGRGNLKDATMEMLADRGNGNYSYIDSGAEARKVLVSEAGATLVTIAKDVKIQVEWNPARVAGYRLLGYENRVLRAIDFADDRKDAGEIGAGHTVTALYEVVPAGLPLERPGRDPLKYQQPPSLAPASASGELATVKLRYKEPEGERSRLVATSVGPSHESEQGSPRLRFAAAVAAFGMLLRESEHRGGADWPMVLELARTAAGPDEEGYRAEFLDLAQRALTLAAPRTAQIGR